MHGISLAPLTLAMWSKLKTFCQHPKGRISFLVAVLLVQSAITISLWNYNANWTPLGFLIKHGNFYRVAWKKAPNEYLTREFDTLEGALEFARTELRLTQSRNPISELELEHLWLQDRFGAFVLFWKTTKVEHLHRLSFQSQPEAQFFAEAFRAGSYSPSPFGHSILLLPVQSP